MSSQRRELIQKIADLREALTGSEQSTADLTEAVIDAQSKASISSQTFAAAMENAVTNYLRACQSQAASTERSASIQLAGLVAAAQILKSIETDKLKLPISRQFNAEQMAIFLSMNGSSFTIDHLKSCVRYFAGVRGEELDELVSDWIALEYVVPSEDTEGSVEYFTINKESGVYKAHIAKPKTHDWIRINGFSSLEEFYDSIEQSRSEVEQG